MSKQNRKTQLSPVDSFESVDFEQAWRALARIIARRHIKNQLNKIEDHTDENIINDDSNGKTSEG